MKPETGIKPRTHSLNRKIKFISLTILVCWGIPRHLRIPTHFIPITDELPFKETGSSRFIHGTGVIDAPAEE